MNEDLYCVQNPRNRAMIESHRVTSCS